MKTNKAIDFEFCTEIALCMLNDHKVYDQTAQLRKNYACKVHKGLFARDLAIIGLDYVIKEFIKQYGKAFNTKFACSVIERAEIAYQLVDHYMEEINNIAEEIKEGKRDRRGKLKAQ